MAFVISVRVRFLSYRAIENNRSFEFGFFDENGGSLKGMNCHELSFYFLMKSRGTQELHSNRMTQGVKEEMRWMPIKDLDKYKVFPTFLKNYLSKEHIGIEHIVTDERM